MLRIWLGALAVLSGCAFENVADEDEVVDDDSDSDTNNDDQPLPLVKCNAQDKTGMVLCIDFEDTAPAGGKPVFRDFFGAAITQQLDVDPMQRMPEQAAQFRTTSVFAIQENPKLDVTQVTMEMWINPKADPGQQNEQGLFDNHSQYKLAWEGGRKIECQIGPSVTESIESDVQLPLDQWSHVACTFNNNQIRVYVNGALEGCKSSFGPAPTYSTEGSAVGARVQSGGQYVQRFDGQLDNVRVYGRALSAGDLCTIATGGSGCDDRCPTGYGGYGYGGGD